MFRHLLLLLAVAGGSAFAQKNTENRWSAIRTPNLATPQAIGGYANGCQMGAQTLAESGDGYVSIRRFRNRYYAQPVTLALIDRVSDAMAAQGRRILIGDLSQPIGGEMPYGHASHQSGLDVDFWFATVDSRERPRADIDKVDPPSMVDKAAGIMAPGRWRSEYRDALHAAATFAGTSRIFVNPVIKQHLCVTESDRRWLQKVRPWGGHDAHFHVRLHCPPDSPFCEAQKALPPGDGCDADLQNWIRDQSDAILNPKPPKPAKPKAPKIPPAACEALLGASFQQ
ncbi:MAG: penicillin-insensitive murein endopeptidase [Cardiobacteriaceae bacterium]|nr:penicillin-insensitive murein endopeptidase [Cardiobacteriaceae bacterium]